MKSTLHRENKWQVTMVVKVYLWTTSGHSDEEEPQRCSFLVFPSYGLSQINNLHHFENIGYF